MMVTILATVTIVSLILTIALAALVVKLLRDERRRSAARTAALAQMADAAIDDAEIGAFQNARDSFEHVRIDSPAGHPLTTHEELFAVRESRPAWPRRFAIAVLLAVIGLGIGAAVRLGMPATPSNASGSAASTGTANAGLLELHSLKHAQENDTLTITGLVQNPRDGVPLSKVAATAFLFSADGSFIASGRAPLDFLTLRPGDESGFVINVTVNAPVARYRIGFRDEDGRIIGHVDRRGSNSIARGPS
jgi:hypothetical protein